MTYVKNSGKSVEEAARDLQAAVERHGFGVLHTYDLTRTLEGKGYPIARECRIFEVCNPGQAQAVLSHDMELNMALPCRVSVYESSEGTRIGMIPPTDVLGLISDSPELSEVAGEVEEAIRRMIDEAA
ncbi:MAG: DUF302 domain-containing protein [Gammaproteobacteria bacterium]